MPSDDETSIDNHFDELIRYLEDIRRDIPYEDTERRQGFYQARYYVREYQLTYIKDTDCSCEDGLAFPEAHTDYLWRCADCGDIIYEEDEYV